MFPKTKVRECFCGRIPKLSINFEEILSRTLGNFKEQNKVSELSIIIINYCVIIIIAYYILLYN